MDAPQHKKPGVKVSASVDRTNTLGLSDRDMAMLIDTLDASNIDGSSKERQFSRWPFRRTGVILEITHPGGSTSAIKVVCRNISRGGVSLLHTTFIHTGSPCRVTIAKATGMPVILNGIIRRCTHRSGKVHELGVAFTEPIDLRQFIPPRKEQSLLSFEKVDPAALAGKLLFIEDSPLDIKIIKHFLRDTQVRITVAETADAAMIAAKEPYDLIICDWHLGHQKGTRVISQLRNDGVETSVIMISADPAGLIKDGLWDLNNAWYLAKPVQQDHLLRAMAERLILDKQASNGAIDEKEQQEGNGLAGQFVDDLRVCINKLKTALEASDIPEARQVCWQLKGAAPAFGFPDLGQTAGDAAAKLSKEDAQQAAPMVIKQLLAACERAMLAA